MDEIIKTIITLAVGIIGGGIVTYSHTHHSAKRTAKNDVIKTAAEILHKYRGDQRPLPYEIPKLNIELRKGVEVLKSHYFFKYKAKTLDKLARDYFKNEEVWELEKIIDFISHG